MNIYYSDSELPEDLGKSIFLAGPTPRKQNVASWRPKAICILEKLNFDGNVLVPEFSTPSSKINYNDQVEWEYKGLTECSVILFWIPRKSPHMQALTTNVEFGTHIRDERVVYGRPDWGEKNKYLDWLYEKFRGEKPIDKLYKTIEIAVDKCNKTKISSNSIARRKKDTSEND